MFSLSYNNILFLPEKNRTEKQCFHRENKSEDQRLSLNKHTLHLRVFTNINTHTHTHTPPVTRTQMSTDKRGGVHGVSAHWDTCGSSANTYVTCDTAVQRCTLKHTSPYKHLSPYLPVMCLLMYFDCPTPTAGRGANVTRWRLS